MIIQVGALGALEFCTQAPSQVCLGFQHLLEFDILDLLPIKFRDVTYEERIESVQSPIVKSIDIACLFGPSRRKIPVLA
jgi:hypothetical protein